MPEERAVADALRFDMLGPLQLGRGDQAGTIGSGKQRLLLAALLVDANTVVSSDRLCHLLWEDAPPRQPGKSLHTHVSRLRDLLGRAGGASARDALATRPPGYVLQVDLDRIDAHRFEQSLHRAQRIGDPSAALELLDDALALWRGPALAGLDHEFARIERGRLDELRLTAIEARIDASLQLGRHADVVGELDRLLADHPFRERLRAQWMLALYRCGRQAEALAGFRRFRDQLADELGLEASEPLRHLELEILQQAEHLAWSPPRDHPAGTGSPEVAGQRAEPVSDARASPLPAELTTFVGRERETDELVAALDGARLVTLVGAGGVGKTRLAIRVARQVAPRYDAVVFCDLSPVGDDAAVAEAVATTLGARSQRGRTAEDAVLQLLRAKRLLLVVDNCEHVVESAARLIARVVSVCPGVVVLATSRRPLAIDGEQLWPVEPLAVTSCEASPPPAVRLFYDRAQALLPELSPTEVTPAVIEICRRLDGLPLAIELAAARVRSLSPRDIAARLEGRFDLLTGGRRTAADRHQTLRAVVDWSYALLDPAARHLFDRLSVFAGSFPLAAVEEVCGGDGIPTSDVTDLIDQLVDHSLVVADHHGEDVRFRLLETLRQYGRRNLSGRDETTEVLRRMARYYLRLASEAEAGITGPDEAHWVRVLDDELDNVRQVVRWAADRGELDVVFAVTAAMFHYAVFCLRDEVFGWAQETVEMPDASSHPRYASACGVAGMGCLMRGDHEAATRYAERGLQAVPEADDPRRELPLTVLADEALYQGDLMRLREVEEASLRLAQRTGDRYGEAFAYLDLTLGHAYAGERSEAMGHLHRLARVARASGNPTALAWHRYANGEVLRTSDDRAAVACFEEAIELATSVDNGFTAAVARVSLASLEARHGEPSSALRSFRNVIRHWHDAGDWTHQWTTLRNLVTLFARMGADEPAVVLRAAVLSAETAAPVYGDDADRMAALASSLRADVGTGAFTAADGRGRAMSDEESVAYALAEIDRLLATRPAGTGSVVS